MGSIKRSLLVSASAIVTLLAVATAMLTLFTAPSTRQMADTYLSSDAAVRLALRYAADNRGVGGYIEKPSDARGKQMPLEEALNLASAQVTGQQGTPRHDGARSAWLFVFAGRFISRVPAAPPDIPARIVEHSQMIVILDAQTGDPLQSTLVTPALRFDASALPVIAIPANAVEEATVLPASLASPLATVAPR